MSTLSGVIFTLIILTTLPAHASFWFACELELKVDSASVTEAATTISTTIVDAELDGGHIDDPPCNLESGAPFEITSVLSDEEKNAGNRKITKTITAGDHKLDTIRAGDVIEVRYEFYNQRTGDSHSWEILDISPVK